MLKRDISHIIFLSLTIYIVYKPDLIDKVSRPKFFSESSLKKKKKYLVYKTEYTRKSRGATVITSQTLYHWAMWEKEKMPITSILSKDNFNDAQMEPFFFDG